MEFTEGSNTRPDVGICKCLSLEELYRKEFASVDEEQLQMKLRHLNIFLLTRMSPFPLKLIRRPDLSLEPMDFLNLFASFKEISVIEVPEKINEFIEKTVDVQMSSVLFPFKDDGTMCLHCISGHKLKGLIKMPIDKTIEMALSECQPFFENEISETFQDEIAKAAKIKIESLLGVPLDKSSSACYASYTDIILLCLVNKKFEVDEDKKNCVSGKGSENLDTIQMKINKFTGTDVLLAVEVLGYLGPIILTCASCIEQNRRDLFKSLLAIANDLLLCKDKSEYFEKLMSSARKVFKAKRALLLLTDETSQFLIGNIYGKSDGVEDAVVGIKVPNRHGSLGRVIFTKEYTISSCSTSDRFYCKTIDKMTNFTTVNSLSCPISFGDNVYGVLEFHNKPDPFVSSDKELLTVVSILCVIGLHMSSDC